MSNDTQTLTLTEFVLARIAEDEADPWRGAVLGGMVPCGASEHRRRAALERAWETRVLADCEAKRRIVDLTLHGCGDDYERVQRALALPYADHPDFNPKWRI